jgi:phage baseplate assembly protein W
VAPILAHPLRLAGTALEVVDQASDAGNAQQLAILLSTRRGERPLVPTFGTSDPTYADVDDAELTATVATFGPPVDVITVETTYDEAGRTAVTLVEFT